MDTSHPHKFFSDSTPTDLITPNNPNPELIYQLFDYFYRFQSQSDVCQYYLSLFGSNTAPNALFNQQLMLSIERDFSDIAPFYWENKNSDARDHLMTLTFFHLTKVDAKAVLSMVQADPNCACLRLSKKLAEQVLFIPIQLTVQSSLSEATIKKIGLFLTDTEWVGMPIFLLDHDSANAFKGFLAPILADFNSPISCSLPCLAQLESPSPTLTPLFTSSHVLQSRTPSPAGYLGESEQNSSSDLDDGFFFIHHDSPKKTF